LQNPNMRLKPNMFAYVTFFGPKETVSMIPMSALVPTRAMNLVFVEVEPWIFEARAVGIGLLEGSRDIVANGLKVGDRVVVRGGGLLLGYQAH
jgi:cobalt-zinc-cadmium efflux system membrane fusion protein